MKNTDNACAFGAMAVWLAAGVLGSSVLIINDLGVCPSYAEGDAEGTITNCVYGGLIYKTYEATISPKFILNNGDHCGDQYKNIRFSTPDKDVGTGLMKFIGQNVRVHFKVWYVSPYREGSTNNIVQVITRVDSLPTRAEVQ
jgi:hypothetical protein